MVITNNILALTASRHEGINSSNLESTSSKLASGSKINKASEDASGLAISEKMRSQIRGLNRASNNITDMSSMANTIDGYLSETTEIIQRIRELAIQAGNGIYSEEDRGLISVEVSSLISEIDRIASQATFNGMVLLSGGFSERPIVSHIGANMDQRVQLYIGTMTAQALGLKGTENGQITLIDVESSNSAIHTLDEALKKVNVQRANIGSFQNRMEMAKKGIDITAENIQSAESKIRDTDFAKEVVENVKNQVLQSSTVAMLAQANMQSQNVLTLLR